MDNNGYAVRYVRVGGKRLVVLMHRFLLDLVPGDGIQADHIHGNRLDNRRQNLRIATNAQNHQNLHWCGPHRGTVWGARRNCWLARVTLDGKTHHLGQFATREEAAAIAAAFRHKHMPYSADARKV